jgi:hypothetical protein
MKLDYREREVLTETRGAYYVWQLENVCTLQGRLHEYRKDFLSKRKNVNKYKKQPNGTPKIIDKMINAFDRKIKGVPILKDEVKKIYMEGIESIFDDFYNSLIDDNTSKQYYYRMYQADMYCNLNPPFTKAKNRKEPKYLSFREFKMAGLVKKYKNERYS